MDRFDDVYLVEQLFANILPCGDKLDAITCVIDTLYSKSKYSNPEYCMYDDISMAERLATVKDLISRLNRFSNQMSCKKITLSSIYSMHYLDEYGANKKLYDTCMRELERNQEVEPISQRIPTVKKYSDEGRILWYQRYHFENYSDYEKHFNECEFEKLILVERDRVGSGSKHPKDKIFLLHLAKQYYDQKSSPPSKDWDDKVFYDHISELCKTEEEKYSVKPLALSYFLDEVRDIVFKENQEK